MGKVVSFSSGDPARTTIINEGAVASHTETMLSENLIGVESVVGSLNRAAKQAVLSTTFISPLQENMPDVDDGAVFHLRGDDKAPIVAVSDNVARFFIRNGRSRKEAFDDVGFYATAMLVGNMARTNRKLGIYLPGDTVLEQLWREKLKMQEPIHQSMVYRFAAYVLNEAGRGVVRSTLKPGSSFTPHMASFVDPMKKKPARDLASSLQKMA